jgi:hypothetical protein
VKNVSIGSFSSELEEIEYELDIAEGRTLRFHVKCLEAWHAARTERMSE